MTLPLQAAPQAGKAARWTGWALSIVLALFLLSGSVTAFLQSPQVFEGLSKLGYSRPILRPLAALELILPILYLIPRTAVLGAILFTAYLGGAVASHARIGDPMWVVPVVFGILIWCALLLRAPRLRQLVLPTTREQ
jgi:hypothetical protein